MHLLRYYLRPLISTTMSELTGIFKVIEEHTFTADKCFLCGCQLTPQTRTEEHVIPKWLQHAFKLWDQKVTLLNGTLLPYRRLTIPCCFTCNNNHLEPFENTIKKAFQSGLKAFKQLDKETLFYWLGKIYFGLMYRELFLPVDRSDPQGDTITNPEYVGSFYNHLLFLQGIRKKHQFSGFFPASMYFFPTQQPADIQDQFDLIDSHNALFISMRLGEVGVICALQDCGATLQLDNTLDQHRDIVLHPLQFRELTAKILYKVLLMNRTPTFISHQQDELVQTHLTNLQGLSNKPIFDDWDNDAYSKILSVITGVPLSVCQPEKGKVWTWLMDTEGKSIFIDVNERPS